MNLRPILYGAAFALVHCLAACSSSPGEADKPPVEKTEAQKGDTAAEEASLLVVAFGDSLYAGYGVSQDESLPDDLEDQLRANGLSVRVHNAGVSGDTTAAGRQRLAFVLDGLDRKPDLVLLGLGGNDMLRALKPEETRANMDAMLAELKKREIPVILTGMLAAPNLGKDYADAFNPIYGDMARKYDATLYPFLLDGVVIDPLLMQADRIHPTAKGIDVIVGKLAPVVEAELRKD